VGAFNLALKRILFPAPWVTSWEGPHREPEGRQTSSPGRQPWERAPPPFHEPRQGRQKLS